SSSSCHHLVVLSFPTLRSSDLRGYLVRMQTLELFLHVYATSSATSRLDFSTLCGSSDSRPDHPSCDRIYLGSDRITRSPSAVGGDRKSTRLNSSHVSISYAVFC